MRIACITAGAGRMYCGSCLRDNTLASALLDAGQDVVLIPLYTPTRTDESNVSMPRVFLGGINIYLQHRYRFFRLTPGLLDRLWDSRPLLRLAGRWGMSVDPSVLGSLTVATLRGMRGFLKKEIGKLVRFLAELSPDVVNLPNSMLSALAPAIKAEMKVPVCCTLQGEDLFLNGLLEPYRGESLRLIAENAAHVDAFIAISHYGAESMAAFLGIDRGRIRVAPLGIRAEAFGNRRAAPPDPFTVGYLARIAPEKGLHVLCDAYRILRAGGDLPPGRLHAAGYLAPEHRAYLSDIRRNMGEWGLAPQFRYFGEVDRADKLEFLKGLSVFSVPGVYDDPKGLFLLEALAAGIPAVQPRRGAFTEILETTGGGLLVEPDDPEALARGILELWRDPQKREELGACGSRNVRRHYTAAGMAEAALAVYRSVV